LRGLLYPIVQEVVVARKIGGIENHEELEYNMLCKPRPDAEFALLQKLQESMHKNGKNLRDNIRDIVIPFFKDDTEDEKVNHVKYETFNVGGCASIMEEEHHVYQAFNAMEHPTVNGPTRPRPRAGARARPRSRAHAPALQAGRALRLRLPAAARGRYANSVGYCADDGPAVTQEFMPPMSTD
jgi:hypothetical protein